MRHWRRMRLNLMSSKLFANTMARSRSSDSRTLSIPEIKNVNYTNFVDIGFRVYTDNNQLIIFSAIDNLVKGAAGQAVQNMNIMFGFTETEGLLS